MIALAMDQILMDENAVLGPVDPQSGKCPSVSILAAVSKKKLNRMDNKTLIFVDVAEKALRQVEDFVTDILQEKMPDDQARSTTKPLAGGAVPCTNKLHASG